MARFQKFVCMTIAAAGFTTSETYAQDSDITEFKDPPICSSFEQPPGNDLFGCEVRPIGKDKEDKRNLVKIRLRAQTGSINIGGVDVVTDNYGTYLPPVVEADE